MWAPVCHITHVEVRGQLIQVGSPSHEGPRDRTQVGRFVSKCLYCWAISPDSIFYVALNRSLLIGHLVALSLLYQHLVDNMFLLQKCQLSNVPFLTFVALTPSMTHCHGVHVAGFQGPGMQGLDQINLAYSVLFELGLRGLDKWGKMKALGKEVWLTEGVVSSSRCALKLHCPWLSPEGRDQRITYHFKSSMKNNVRILHGNLKNIAYKLMVVWMCWVKLISQIILPVFTL